MDKPNRVRRMALRNISWRQSTSLPSPGSPGSHDSKPNSSKRESWFGKPQSLSVAIPPTDPNVPEPEFELAEDPDAVTSNCIVRQCVNLNQAELFAKDQLWWSVTKGHSTHATRMLARVAVTLPNNLIVKRGLVERGPEGETLLHAALQFGKDYSQIKHILDSFRDLLRCKYLGDKYKGQTALHVAVVQYDDNEIDRLGVDGKPGSESVVKLLLDTLDNLGSDVKRQVLQTRVTGSEFKKESGGLRFYGESILHFAVASGKFKTVKLLLHHLTQLEIAAQEVQYTDSISGYNVLHFVAKNKNMTTSQFKEMFSFLKEWQFPVEGIANATSDKKAESEKDTNSRIQSPPTPFELGILEGNVNILEGMKEYMWEFDNVTRYRVPLDDLDPLLYEENRKTRGKHSTDISAIQRALESHNKEFITHPVIDTLLRYKWTLYARGIFLTRFLATFVLIVLFVTPAIAWQSKTFTDRRSYATDLLKNWHDGLRLFFELGSVVGVLVILWFEFVEFRARGHQFYFRGYASWENYVQLTMCGIVGAVAVVRAVVVDENVGLTLENLLLGVLAIVAWIYLLNFGKCSEKLGPLVFIAWKVMSEDFMYWLIIYSSVTIGFAGAMFLQMQTTVGYTPGTSANVTSSANQLDPSQNWNTYIGAAVWVMRGVFQQGVWNDFSLARTPAIAQMLFVFYSFFVVILLINLLIGKVTRTLEAVITDSTREWKMSIASLIVGIDLQLTASSRQRKLKKVGFSKRGSDKKYFLFTAHRDGTEIFEVKVGERVKVDNAGLKKDGVGKEAELDGDEKEVEPINKSPNQLRYWSR